MKKNIKLQQKSTSNEVPFDFFIIELILNLICNCASILKQLLFKYNFKIHSIDTTTLNPIATQNNKSLIKVHSLAPFLVRYEQIFYHHFKTNISYSILPNKSNFKVLFLEMNFI